MFDLFRCVNILKDLDQKNKPVSPVWENIDDNPLWAILYFHFEKFEKSVERVPEEGLVGKIQ